MLKVAKINNRINSCSIAEFCNTFIVMHYCKDYHSVKNQISTQSQLQQFISYNKDGTENPIKGHLLLH